MIAERPTRAVALARVVALALGAALAVGCGAEHATLRVVAQISADQYDDYARLASVTVTLRGPSGYRAEVPLAGALEVAGRAGLPFATSLSVTVEGRSDGGGTPRLEFLGETPLLAVSSGREVAVNVQVRRLDDFARALGAMAAARSRHTATRLPDGRVLLVGGLDARGEPLASAEIYDPDTSRFTLTGALRVPRARHAAVAVGADVVVAGGLTAGGGYTRSVERWDAATGQFTRLDDLTAERADLTATLVAPGGAPRVVLAGGRAVGGAGAAIDVLDVTTMRLRPPRTLLVARAEHAAAALDGDRVLLVGGTRDTAAAEVFDARDERGLATGAMAAPRARASVAQAADGAWLVAGDGAGVERFEADGAGRFAPLASLPAARDEAPLAALPAGGAIVIGGGTTAAPLADAHVLVASGTPAFFPTVAPLDVARVGHALTPLRDGTILVTGGTSERLAEVYQPRR